MVELDKQFSKLCSLLSTPWSTSPLYSTNATRVANRSTLIPLLIESLSKKTTAEWLLVMQGHGFPFAPVNDIAGTFSHPQAIDRGVVVEVEHPRAGKIKLLAPAVVYNGEKMKVRSAPPVLGQHTVEVLKEEFGYTAEEIVDFQQDGAIN